VNQPLLMTMATGLMVLYHIRHLFLHGSGRDNNGNYRAMEPDRA